MSIMFGAIADGWNTEEHSRMGAPGWGLVLEVAGLGCWVACFIWMYRISARQEELLHSLHDQAKRIAELSKAEHDLIKEVHPQVGEIHESMKEVAEVMANAENAAADGGRQSEPSRPPSSRGRQ